MSIHVPVGDDPRRKLPRQTLSRVVPVEDVINGGAFGELVNLTADGLMAITDHPVTPRAVFQLALRLPESIAGADRIVIGADCLWSRCSDDYHRYWAGFSIIDIAEDDRERLATLLTDYGQS